MIVIGIAGGVASGKSFVTEGLRQLGAEILDADRAGHQVLLDDEVKQSIRDRWGDRVFDSKGNIDRRAVGRIVFASPPEGPQELAFLEQLTHPRIGRSLRDQLDDLATRKSVYAVVLDAAVMFKAGWDEFCDRIIFVDAPRELRHRRARQRGWSEAQLAAREASQISLEEKRNCADVIIDNSGSPEATLSQINQFWKSLLLSEA